MQQAEARPEEAGPGADEPSPAARAEDHAPSAGEPGSEPEPGRGEEGTADAPLESKTEHGSATEPERTGEP
jgi:hypothetical protein